MKSNSFKLLKIINLKNDVLHFLKAHFFFSSVNALISRAVVFEREKPNASLKSQRI